MARPVLWQQGMRPKLPAVLVALVHLAACGRVDRGIIEADGDRTEPTRTEEDSMCPHEVWDYDVAPNIACPTIEKWKTPPQGTADCAALCNDTAANCNFEANVNGTEWWPAGTPCPSTQARLHCSKRIDGRTCMVEGRRTEGLDELEATPFDGVGPYFAYCAHLEAAAVVAFERLEGDLSHLGAPKRLVARVRRAAAQERRHVTVASRLSRRYGSEPQSATFSTGPLAPRSLAAIATENMIEGVVRETYGALVAVHRSQSAMHPEVRKDLALIARDECSHAELSWDLANWFRSNLEEEEWETIRARAAFAFYELRNDLGTEPKAAIVRETGAPSAAVGMQLLEGLGDLLEEHFGLALGPRATARLRAS